MRDESCVEKASPEEEWRSFGGASNFGRLVPYIDDEEEGLLEDIVVVLFQRRSWTWSWVLQARKLNDLLVCFKFVVSGL